MFISFYGENGSGILNVFETNKHLNTKQNNLVVQIRRNIFAIAMAKMLRPSFIQDRPVFNRPRTSVTGAVLQTPS